MQLTPWEVFYDTLFDSRVLALFKRSRKLPRQDDETNGSWRDMQDSPSCGCPNRCRLIEHEQCSVWTNDNNSTKCRKSSYFVTVRYAFLPAYAAHSAE